MHDGGLLASWRIGSAKDTDDGTICFSRSADQGRTWSEPTVPFDRPSPGRPGTFDLESTHGSLHYAALTPLPDGRVLASIMWLDRTVPDRPMFNDETEGLVRIETLLSSSADGGQTWSEPYLMDAAPFEGLAGLCAPAMVLPDGTLAAQLEINKPWTDPEPWHHRAILKFSSDSGKTWPTWSEVAYDPTTRIRYWDQRHALGPDGTLLAGLWAFDSVGRKELNFHLAESINAGHTWSEPWNSGLDYQQPYPVFLPDGRLVVIVIDRYRSRTIRALLSRDRGRSFDSQDLELFRQPSGQDRGESDHKLSDQQLWSFGRVEPIPLDERTLAGVFYAGDSARTSIYCFRLDATLENETEV
jgi:hypothetical protein